MILKERISIGGKCQHCGAMIARGQKVFKLDDGRKRAWSVTGAGPGSWVCLLCAMVDSNQLVLDFGS